MKRFRFPRRNRKYLDEETPLQRLCRVLLILLLFGAVVLGFWLNNKRRMEMLKKTVPGGEQSVFLHFPDTELYGSAGGATRPACIPSMLLQSTMYTSKTGNVSVWRDPGLKPAPARALPALDQAFDCDPRRMTRHCRLFG